MRSCRVVTRCAVSASMERSGLLLERHPTMVDVGELRAELADVPVDEAIAALQDDGLATLLGEIVGRRARRCARTSLHSEPERPGR